MSDNTKKTKRNSNDEYLVLILSLVILALILYDKFYRMPYTATGAARQAIIDCDIPTMDSQIKLYREQIGMYPASLDDLTKTFFANKDINMDGVVNNKDTYGPWAKSIPMRPDGGSYTYNPQTGEVTAP